MFDHPKEWHDERRKGVGGSDATKIMSGEWRDLWLVKTGRAEGDDLSRILAVQMGTFTEPFNRDWFSRETGLPVDTENCDHLVHQDHSFMRGNLDGRIAPDAILECKHVGAKFNMDEIAARYYWQLQHYMAVGGEQQTYLSVLFGNSKWDYTIIKRDDKALADLIAQETEFWQHVTDDIEPEDRIPEGKVDVNTRAMREVDATGNNMWGTAAAQWLECRTSAKKFKDADADIKKLIEPDVRRMFGHGIEVKRASNGSLRIGEKND